jgi:hypothetical protein
VHMQSPLYIYFRKDKGPRTARHGGAAPVPAPPRPCPRRRT